MQTETTLVGAQGRVELHTISTVDLNLALVVLPHDAELDDALGDGDDLECGAVLGVLLEKGGGLEGRSKLIVSLLEFGLGRKVGHFGFGLGGLGREVCGLGITQNIYLDSHTFGRATTRLRVFGQTRRRQSKEKVRLRPSRKEVVASHIYNASSSHQKISSTSTTRNSSSDLGG